MSVDSKDKETVKVTICEWTNYSGKRCRSTTSGSKLCAKHDVLIGDYKIMKYPDKNKQELCSTTKNHKVAPRSKEHLKGLMKKYGGYETDDVNVYTTGGMAEDGDISHQDYIKILSDETCYYYEPARATSRDEKSQLNANKLRVEIIESCDNVGIINVRSTLYCKQCYIKESKKNGHPTIETIETKP